MRKSIRRRYKPSLQTNGSIKEIITTTVVTVITLHITATERNYVALYIIGKNITYRDILRRSKKNLKLSLELLIEIGLVNSTTNLKNDLTNILWTTKMTILT